MLDIGASLKNRKEQHTVVHEIGHAVIAAAYGIRFNSVSILKKQNGKSLGRLNICDQDVECTLLIHMLLAGAANEKLLLGIFDKEGARQDFSYVTELTQTLNLEDEVQTVINLLHYHREKSEVLIPLLREQKRIREYQVLRLFRRNHEFPAHLTM